MGVKRVVDLIQKKKSGNQITMLTAFDYITAQILCNAGVDVILVGDSLGNVFNGYETTLPVTVDEMIYHTKAVVRGNQTSMVVADMPFLSYQISSLQAKETAGRLLKEGGAHGVKIEVGPSQLSDVAEILGMGIPVMGHIGFRPQSVHQLGGYRVQGRKKDQEKELIDIATKLAKLGCFAIVLEMVPPHIATHISRLIEIPTIGIGAGVDCDGQVLVTHDLWGMTHRAPKFSKQYADIRTAMTTAVNAYIQEVHTKQFPSPEFYVE
jgi:3-methyl-2-oxobutanoate hydroxymethyltransferase